MPGQPLPGQDLGSEPLTPNRGGNMGPRIQVLTPANAIRPPFRAAETTQQPRPPGLLGPSAPP